MVVTGLIAAVATVVIGTTAESRPAGPMIANRTYYGEITAPDSLGPDVDEYVATFLAGEGIQCVATSKQGRGVWSDLLPTVDLVSPDGTVLTPKFYTRRSGKEFYVPDFRVPETGEWTVRVSGDQGTLGTYSSRFKVRNRRIVARQRSQLSTKTAVIQRTHSVDVIAGSTVRVNLRHVGVRSSQVQFLSILGPDGANVAVPPTESDLPGVSEFDLPDAAATGTYEFTIVFDPSAPADAWAQYEIRSWIVPPDRLRSTTPFQLSKTEPRLNRAPTSVSAAPGGNVTFQGSNFSTNGKLRVQLDGQDVPVVSASGSSVEVTVPSTLSVATADVTVYNADGQADSIDGLLALSQAAPPPAPPAPPAPTPTPTPTPTPSPSANFTWTDFTPSTGTRTVYVSSSTGNDANDGLSQATPVKTIAKGYSLLRTGQPDWLLLKRGDTWNLETLMIDKKGKSQSEPMLFSAYGSGSQRPRLLDSGLKIKYGVDCSNMAFVGLHLERTSPSAGGPGAAMQFLGHGDHLLIEDCYAGNYATNMVIQGEGGQLNDLRIRGSVIVDAYSTSTAHSQGLYLENAHGVLIEGCVFDHNGWSATNTLGVPTVFNHNMYIQYDCSNVTVRNTISAQASSHGLQLRPGGVCDDNLFLANPIGALFGSAGVAWANVPVGGSVQRNVVLESRDIDGRNQRGHGLWIERVKGVEVAGNVVAHKSAGGDAKAFTFYDLFEDVYVHDNVVYDWTHPTNTTYGFFIPGTGSGTNRMSANRIQQSRGVLVKHNLTFAAGVFAYSGNTYWSGAAANSWFQIGTTRYGSTNWPSVSGEASSTTYGSANFSHPDRTIDDYDASIGGSGSLASFLAEARKQSRATWRNEYSAVGANAYFRANFDLP